MRFLKTRMFFTIIVVACLSVAFLSITQAHAASVATTHPLTSEQGNPSSKVVLLNTSGHRCGQSKDGKILACISINSNHKVIPDGYLNISVQNVTITLIDLTNPKKDIASIELQPASKHVVGESEAISAGNVYMTSVRVVLNNGSIITVFSPKQKA